MKKLYSVQAKKTKITAGIKGKKRNKKKRNIYRNTATSMQTISIVHRSELDFGLRDSFES